MNLFAQSATERRTLFSLVSPSGVRASAVDSSGNVYLAGDTAKDVIPVTANAFQPKLASGACPQSPGTGGICSHAFAVKISADGSRILYATYLGGSTGSERVAGIAVDSSGNAYITGTTYSADFPLTPAAYERRPSEGFLTKLNADGSALLGSTYLRGAEPSAIAVDSAGNAYVAGTTTLGNPFTATQGAIQPTSPGDIDAFVLKLNPSLQTAVYSTFLGSGLPDWGFAVAVDTDGNAYVTGTTLMSENAPGAPGFPVTDGVFSRRTPGSHVFVAKVSPDGSRLVASTVIGGPSVDVGYAIAIDSKRDVYVGGTTGSSNFLSAGTIGVNYGFALKLSADFANLLYGTALPGKTNSDAPNLFQLSLRGDHLIFKHESRAPLHTTPGAFQPCLAAPNANPAPFDQSYVLELDAAGGTAAYATYARGAYAMTPDSVYVLSADSNRFFEKTALAAQPSGTVTCVANGATYSENTIAPGEIVSILGSGIGPQTPRTAELDSTGKVATTLGGVTVRVNGQAAPVLYASPSQINAVIPFEAAASTELSIQVVKDATALNTIRATAAAATPGVFAIVNPDGTINDPDHPAPKGSTLAVFLTGVGLMQPVAETGSIGKGNTRIAASVSATLRAFVTGTQSVIPLEIAYAGDAPAAVQGFAQVNVRLPDVLPNALPTALKSVDIKVGDAAAVSVPVWFTP